MLRADLRKGRAGLQRRVAQADGIALQGRDPAPLALISMLRNVLGKPGRHLSVALALGLPSQRALLELNAPAKAREQRIVGMKHERALALVRTPVRVHAGGARHHLLEPGPAADG